MPKSRQQLGRNCVAGGATGCDESRDESVTAVPSDRPFTMCPRWRPSAPANRIRLPNRRPPHRVLVEAGAEAPQPAGRVRAFAYLDTESTHRYRQLMGVLLANKRRFGLRMAPDADRDAPVGALLDPLRHARGARARPRGAVRLGRRRPLPGQLPRLLDARVQAQALHLRHHRRGRDRRARGARRSIACPSGSGRSSARSCRSCSTR